MLHVGNGLNIEKACKESNENENDSTAHVENSTLKFI
jgi:hypothetical protein